MSLTNIRKKVSKELVTDNALLIADIINENGAFIVGLLKQQLRMGKDSKNENVTVFGRDYYSDRTVFEKDRKRQETRWITNHDTGVFYLSIYVYASAKTQSFIFDSDAPHFSKILLQSGDVIMGLNPENLRRVREEIIIPQLKLRRNAV
jgi:hypothetical protein